MKIAYLSGAILPSRKANAVHIMKMCAAFAANGHDVTLIAGGLHKTEDPFSYYGVPETFRISAPSFAQRHPSPPLAAVANLRAVTALDADLWYVRSRSLGPFVGRRSIPVVFEAHELPRRRRDRFREELVFRHPGPRRLVTISQALMDDYTAELGSMLRGCSRVVAHDGADLPSSPRPYRTSISSQPRIGYVGSLYPGKGVETIIGVAQLRPNLLFEVVGGSRDEISRWRQNGAPANVHFHGHVPHRDLGPLYATFDLALLPLLEAVSVDFRGSDIGRWTSPLKLFEYMSHGLPIIASDRPTIREVLEDGRTGFLVPAGDMTAWAETIDQVIANYGPAAEAGVRAQALLSSDYTWSARAGAVIAGLAR